MLGVGLSEIEAAVIERDLSDVPEADLVPMWQQMWMGGEVRRGRFSFGTYEQVPKADLEAVADMLVKVRARAGRHDNMNG